MAIDSENKRRSVMAALAVRVYPVADGTIDAGDRQHVGEIYRGVLVSTPPIPPVLPNTTHTLPVTVRVPVDDSWKAGDTLQLYTDDGSGTIDTGKPLLMQRMEMFPGTFAVKGYGEEPYGETAYGGEVPVAGDVGGYGDQPYGEELDGYGEGQAHIDVRVMVAQGYGVYKFAAESVDKAGNVQGGGLVELTQLVSGDGPPPLSKFTFGSYDAVNDQVSFDL